MTLSNAQLLIDSGVNWINYLENENENDNGVLGYTFYTSTNSIPDYWYVGNNPTNGFKPEYTLIAAAGTETYVTDDQQSIIRYYLSDTVNIDYRISFSDVSSVFFEEQSSPASTGEIFILNADVQTAGTDTVGTTVTPQLFYDTFSGDTFLDNVQYQNLLQNQLQLGEEGAWATLHELGHAVAGLNHPTEVGLTGQESTIKYTVMASLGATHPDMINTVFPSGLQLYDIVALQSIYGADTTTRVNATTYKSGQGFHSNTSEAFIYTIWDAGGNDWIDATGYTTGVQIDLREGHFSSIGNSGMVDLFTGAPEAVAWDDGSYDSGNVAIAYGAVIENAIGTDADDHIIGNDADNRLEGRNGDDLLQGGRGHNEYLPGFGTDQIIANGGYYLFGTSKVAGYDILNLTNFVNGVDAQLNSYTSIVSGEGEGVVIGGFEDIRLGVGNDIYHGAQANNVHDNVQQVIDLGDGTDTYIIANKGYLSNGIVTDGGSTALNAEIFRVDSHYLYVETLGNQIEGNDLHINYQPIAQGLDITFSQVGGLKGVTTVSDGTTQDTLSDVDAIIGSNHGDTVSLVGSARYWTGLGDDTITITDLTNNNRVAKITYGGGEDHVYNSSRLSELRLGSLVDEANTTFTQTILSESTYSGITTQSIDLEIAIQGQGSITLHTLVKKIINAGASNEYAIFNNGVTKLYFGDGRTVNALDYTPSGSVTTTFTSTQGTHGNDDLIDIFRGGAGDDILRWSGTGPTGLYGGLGNDTLYGGLGSDTLRGEFGNDTLYGGDNIDYLHGNQGDDTLYGEGGNDRLMGSLGNDVIYGGDGNDYGYGGFGADELYGGDGDDILDGGTGSDTIDGGAGNDHLRGGVDNDIFVFGVGYGDDTIHDFGIGQNTIDLTATGLTTSQSLPLTLSGETDSVLTLTDGSTLTIKGFKPEELTQNYFLLVTEIIGTSVSDILTGTAGADLISGLEGVDYLYGGLGDDTIHGGDDADRLYGEEGDDTLNGDGGNDYIYGHEGNDTLNGGVGADSIYGLEGDDTIYGGADNDILRGDDTNSVSGFVDAGNDVIYGDGGNDNISGGDGDDELYGGTENDVIHGDDGADILYGDDGADFLYGGVGTDTLNGGNGNDKLYGEAGADTLDGGAGTDTLYGGDDNDILIGGTGTDFLYGQGGADTFKLDLSSIDRLSDFDDSEGDTIDIADLLIDYNSGTDDINDFVTLVYRNAGRTDIRVNDDGVGNDLPYVGIVFSDLTGETVNTLVASGTLIVE